ncbi:MAG TPA: 1-deoxy-D-xylulose-5-phosphate synthase [Candidatus Acidoferrum sp.]|nr:1-deoxy-D-xylulose-5-phosphate synthase [Candidatus Acidoferrum sp.]
MDKIDSPSDVKALTMRQQRKLCDELRGEILSVCAKNGGHLSSNLGAVELTVALHRTFDSPADCIVFDVGHQCYAHKLLTGRRAAFCDIRTEGGPSGFPRIDESPHDAFCTGHSSTSISAAAGIAAAKRLMGDPSFTVAVIGDGSMTGGLAYEGLNNAASCGRLLIVLNDNDISISRNVGSVAKYLSKMTSRPGYFRLKDATKKTVLALPGVGRPLYRGLAATKNFVKDAVVNSNMFEDFGYKYYGPLNGHDLKVMEDVFKRVKDRGEAAIVHLKTIKGYGVDYAQRDPSTYHGVPPFDAKTGAIPGGAPSFSHMFGEHLTDMAGRDARIVGITAAMQLGVGLSQFADRFPQRYFDVGIAEQHAVTFAAGLASKGLRPYFAVYSSFLQRAYDQLVHDVAMPRLPVVIGIDRAGFVGDDGETHQGLFDVSFLSAIPGFTIYSPADFAHLKTAMDREVTGPVAIRYPRGGERALPQGRECGDYTVYGEGDTAIITYGRVTGECLDPRATVISLLKINPVDWEAIAANIPAGCKKIAFVEEGMRRGGVGERCAVQFAARGLPPVQVIAIDTFVKHATVARQLALSGLDAPSIKKAVWHV